MSTIGNTSVYASVAACFVDYIYGLKFTLPEDGTVSKISLYTDRVFAVTTTVTAAIYDDSSPMVKLGTSSSVDIPAGGATWYDLAFDPGIELEAGDYYLATLSHDNQYNAYYQAGSVAHQYEAGASFPASIATWDGSAGNRDVSINATYGAAAATNIMLNII